MSKTARRDEAAFAQLDALYAQLPTITCRRQCGVACGAIPLTDLEARRLQVATHRKPKTIPLHRADGADHEQCVYLHRGETCTVYPVRPLICRVWGLVKMLSCPHGCVPDRWLSDRDFLQLAVQVERVGGGRVIRTSTEGLVAMRGESFTEVQATIAIGPLLGLPVRSDAAIEADAERTRNLRALFGGRIVVAIDETRK